MAVLENTVTTADVVTALDVEMATRFDEEVGKLRELLGIFDVEVIQAGQALYQYTVTGSLESDAVAEGDEVPLSEYKENRTAIGEMTVRPYRKMTTAQAILKGGFEGAVLKTDRKMVKDARGVVLSDFFSTLAAGTGAPSGAPSSGIVGLQAALAYADAGLGDALEANSDETDAVVHFVNRQDVAGYLARSEVSTQTTFGLEYLKDYMGVKNVFITSRVSKGTCYATPVENIHIYGVDFAALDQGGLSYTVSDSSLIGVAHVPAYNRASAETNILVGAKILAEATNYIVKATFTDPQ